MDTDGFFSAKKDSQSASKPSHASFTRQGLLLGPAPFVRIRAIGGPVFAFVGRPPGLKFLRTGRIDTNAGNVIGPWYATVNATVEGTVIPITLFFVSSCFRVSSSPHGFGTWLDSNL